MNRDAMLATGIGFGVGLLIMGILLLGPKIAGFLPNASLPNFGFLKNQKPADNSPATAGQAFTIDSPLPEAIEPADTVLVSGKAVSDATAVLQGALDEAVGKATPEGTHAAQLKLTEGTNEIVATMYNKTEVTSLTLTVFYTAEEF